MKNNKHSLLVMFFSFIVTMLLIIAVYATGLSAYRMENTMQAEGFELFRIDKQGEEKMEVVALNQTYQLDLESVSDTVQEAEKYEAYVPSFLKILYYAADGLVNFVDSSLEVIFPS